MDGDTAWFFPLAAEMVQESSVVLVEHRNTLAGWVDNEKLIAAQRKTAWTKEY
jgi:hypothetical protein